MKFLHAADIHLDSPLRGLERYEGAPVEMMRNATRRAFNNMVDLALEERVDFVLIAGDLYDVDWKDYNTGLFFNKQMSRLREADIRVFLVLGNHDAGSRITRQLSLPINVKKFDAHHPSTVKLEDLGVAVHGQSFVQQAVTEDLTRGYPEALPGFFNIGLLHTSADGRPGHAPYAPCSVAGMASRGYDYWALGHVHQREVLHESPWIVFPGCLQGRHVGETGVKGCTLVTVEEGNVVSVEHRPVDVLRWQVCVVDVNGAESGDTVVGLARLTVSKIMEQSDGLPVALRVSIVGACRAHADIYSDQERWINEIRTAVTDVGLDNVWVEKIIIGTRDLVAPEELLHQPGPLSELLRMLRALPEDNAAIAELAAEFQELGSKLPLEVKQGAESIDPGDHDQLRDVLREVEQLLLVRLQEGGEA